MKRKMLLALALLVILLAVIASVYANRDYLAFRLAPEGSYMGGAVLDASDAQLEFDWEAFQNAPNGSYMGAAVTATPADGFEARP